MEHTYYITRRDRWSRDEGPAIHDAEWQACIDGDEELERDGGAETVSWDGHEGVFRLERGNIVGVSPSRDVLAKMLVIAGVLGARVMGHDGVVYVRPPRPRTTMHRTRRVIPRAAASLLLSVVGLALLGAAMAHLLIFLEHEVVTLRGATLSFVTPPLVGVGAVALIASALMAVSSLYPWDRRWSKFAVTALVLDALPLYFIL